VRWIRWPIVIAMALGLSCGDDGADPKDGGSALDGDEDNHRTPIDSASSTDDSGEEPSPDSDAPDDSGADPDTAVEADMDGDGYTVSMGDCDDTNARIHPGGREVCNMTDDDCDGEIDEEAWDARTFHVDADGDGYGDWTVVVRNCVMPEGHVTDSTDCNDANPGSFPGAEEICDDEDNDCDGEIDEDAIDPIAYYRDADGDRYGDPATEVFSCDEIVGWILDGTDCDDLLDTVNPGAIEFCDGIDNDCDGEVDTDATFGERTWYRDADGDGHGDAAVTVVSCTPPTGYVWTSTDCDDTEPARYPTAVESCDLIDNDCDDVVDEDGVCLSCDVDYPTPLTRVYAGTAGGDVDGGDAECYLSGYDYSCDDCDVMTMAIGADGEVTGAYRSLGWVVTSGSATVADATALSTTISLSGATPTEPDECEEFSYTVELRVSECEGSLQTDSISFTLSCCGTG